MSRESDWFPGKRQEKFDMATNWVAVLSEPNPDPGGEPKTNAAAWGIPAERVAELEAQRDTCSKLLRKVNEPTTATSIVRAECKEEFAKLEKKMRALHTFFCVDGFPALALRRLGLIPHGEGGAGHTKDREDIAFSLRTHATNHEIFADFRRLGAQTHDKGVHHAAEARTWILPLDAPAPKSAKTPGWESYESTASPWRRVFDAEHIGKRLHIMMRWENRSLDGDEDAGKGPWSAVQSIIIP